MTFKLTRMVRSRALQRGSAMVETAALTPLFISVFFGFVGLDQMVRSRRSLEWAVGEAMLINNFREDIADGADTATTFTYTYNLSGTSQDPSPNCVTYTGSAAKSRCMAAYESSLLLSRAVRSVLGDGVLQSMSVSFTYQPVTSGSVASNSPLAKNRLLTIRVTGTPAGRGMRSLWPNVLVERTEAIG